MDGYFECCKSAGKPVHLVTVRGMNMCYWERKCISGDGERDDEGKLPFFDGDQVAEKEKQYNIKNVTHFESYESLMEWVRPQKDMFTINIEENIERYSQLMKQENELELKVARDKHMQQIEEKDDEVNNLRKETIEIGVQLEVEKENLKSAMGDAEKEKNAKHEALQRAERAEEDANKQKQYAEAAEKASKKADERVQEMKMVCAKAEQKVEARVNLRLVLVGWSALWRLIAMQKATRRDGNK